MVEWITVQRLGIKQLREFFSFTHGPLLCVRPEETHDIHTVQPNTPAILLTDDDQDSIFHRSPTLEDIRPTIHEHARLAHTSAHLTISSISGAQSIRSPDTSTVWQLRDGGEATSSPGQAESTCQTGHPCESPSVTPRHSQGSNAKRKTTWAGIASM